MAKEKLPPRPHGNRHGEYNKGEGSAKAKRTCGPAREEEAATGSEEDDSGDDALAVVVVVVAAAAPVATDAVEVVDRTAREPVAPLDVVPCAAAAVLVMAAAELEGAGRGGTLALLPVLTRCGSAS